MISPVDPAALYAAANVLFKSTDQGQSWQAISPDLTRNDKTKQGHNGGPLTGDNSSADYYCTIFTVAPSRLEKDTIWTGSDDGLVHVTRDGGKTLEERHAEADGGVDARQHHRGVAARRRHRVRRGHALSVGRLQAVHLQDHRLRRDVDRARPRHPRHRLRARRARGSGAQRTAVRRHRDRRARLLRRWRGVAAAAAESADRADHRSRRAGVGSGRLDAGALVLDPRRPERDPAAERAGSERGGASLPAA